ncbi:hydroxyacylglutathione hydrolase [Blochmannia endosymbiont of Camponotus (Colobopsis) obliquus]|uniref:hydroxyacylglutathione hydrolase n=1 Tax=Blochmannia endosymbiont of Camponotus (Colobopsis) obliquus TaxID=1505597 RepID=UPI00061A646D|nr:hydroxyacylglutathione hydrolase [Blochmannia endosymbiont of Camponotus (Colobopsis) obliquus]AKC60392.1 hydroxyacylglutathione hydrolase [Blochmannia endosymbiont of Camponotus (Colobopsis) obliquus]
MNLINIPSLKDNYIWILYNKNKKCLVIDPGDHKPVLQIIQKLKLNLIAILLTHHHDDHTSGVHKLLNLFPVKVYGPLETINKGTNQVVSNNDNIALLNHNFKILSLPGHTLGHIGYYSHPWLFCGDTIFSAGCGRLLEGTAQQMYYSCQKIKRLPNTTLICSAHEYTLTNITFAASILPYDTNIRSYLNTVKKLHKQKKPTLPSTLELELKVNLFFRCQEKNIKKKLNIHPYDQEEWKTFAALRTKRNTF